MRENFVLFRCGNVSPIFCWSSKFALLSPSKLPAAREVIHVSTGSYVTSGALTIYTIHPGGNFRCKNSVLQLVQTEMEKSENVEVLVGKFKSKMKNALIKPIAYNSEMFQMEWYVPFHFPTRISGFSV